MSVGQTIEHKGFIERITENSVFVRIESQSTCKTCHAKGSCSVSELQDKEVEVQDSSHDFKVGEMVNLIMTQSQGYQALLIAYVYPFILVFLCLLITTSFGMGELNSGLISLFSLLPYYLTVYALKNKIGKKFRFSIRKII